MPRDYRTFFQHLAVMLAIAVGITAFSSLTVWLLLDDWPMWAEVLAMFGILSAVVIIILTCRLMTEWTYFDDDDE